MPTVTMESTARPRVLATGVRPWWNQIAAVISPAWPPLAKRSSHSPAPTSTPAAKTTPTRWTAEDRAAAARKPPLW